MKKVIAFAVALAVLVCLFAVSFSVSADETQMTNQEYYAAQAYLIAKYKDGDISYSEFQQRSQAVTDEYVNSNTVGGTVMSGALNAGNTMHAINEKIGSTVEKYGEAAREHISDWISDFFDSYTVLSDKPTTDLKGSVAMVKKIGYQGYYRIYYGRSNGELYISSGATMIYMPTYCIEHYKPDGTMYSRDEDLYDAAASMQYYSDSTFLYGSWKWREDGSQAPTDDEFETVSDYDFTQASEMELEDLLKKILDEFELKQPDLSSIEGLLNAIYARLGTLDSDNDNALLSSINSAILALAKSNNENNEKLLEELLKFREDLKNGTVGTETAAHGHEISGTLYNVIPLDKNWLNKIFHDKENLKVQYEGKTYYLEDCGCLKLDKKYYTPNMNYDSYAISDYDFSNADIEIDNKYVNADFENYNTLIAGFSSSQKKKVDNVIDLVSKLVMQTVPYSAINGAMVPFETIIFNSAEPEDVVLKFKGTKDVEGFEATILSASFFKNAYVSEAMKIVRPFLTVLIGYFWLKVMRRKAVAMMG